MFASPWARLWAKALDLTIWSLALSYSLDLVAPSLMSGAAFQGSSGATLSTLILLPFAMLLDAVVLASFSTTPGAFVAGFRIEMMDHQRLSLRVAFRRGLFVYFRGLCLGIPLFNLATVYNAYRVTAAGRQASWDEDLFTRPFCYGGGLGRTALAASLMIAVRVIAFIIPTYAGAALPAH